jgi:hypothetical protein
MTVVSPLGMQRRRLVMARSVEKIIFGFKLRTRPAKNALALRVGNKKFVLPFEVRIIQSEDFIFVHIPPAAGIMRIEGKKVELVTKSEDAERAALSFRLARKARRENRVELPDAIKDALKKIPPGYKLGYDADGGMKLVKARKRRKSASKPARRRSGRSAARTPERMAK